MLYEAFPSTIPSINLEKTQQIQRKPNNPPSKHATSWNTLRYSTPTARDIGTETPPPNNLHAAARLAERMVELDGPRRSHQQRITAPHQFLLNSKKDHEIPKLGSDRINGDLSRS
jgi:hypothetical protein